MSTLSRYLILRIVVMTVIITGFPFLYSEEGMNRDAVMLMARTHVAMFLSQANRGEEIQTICSRITSAFGKERITITAQSLEAEFDMATGFLVGMIDRDRKRRRDGAGDFDNKECNKDDIAREAKDFVEKSLFFQWCGLEQIELDWANAKVESDDYLQSVIVTRHFRGIRFYNEQCVFIFDNANGGSRDLGLVQYIGLVTFNNPVIMVNDPEGIINGFKAGGFDERTRESIRGSLKDLATGDREITRVNRCLPNNIKIQYIHDPWRGREDVYGSDDFNARIIPVLRCNVECDGNIMGVLWMEVQGRNLLYRHFYVRPEPHGSASK